MQTRKHIQVLKIHSLPKRFRINVWLFAFDNTSLIVYWCQSINWWFFFTQMHDSPSFPTTIFPQNWIFSPLYRIFSLKAEVAKLISEQQILFDSVSETLGKRVVGRSSRTSPPIRSIPSSNHSIHPIHPFLQSPFDIQFPECILSSRQFLVFFYKNAPFHVTDNQTHERIIVVSHQNQVFFCEEKKFFFSRCPSEPSFTVIISFFLYSFRFKCTLYLPWPVFHHVCDSARKMQSVPITKFTTNIEVPVEAISRISKRKPPSVSFQDPSHPTSDACPICPMILPHCHSVCPFASRHIRSAFAFLFFLKASIFVYHISNFIRPVTNIYNVNILQISIPKCGEYQTINFPFLRLAPGW